MVNIVWARLGYLLCSHIVCFFLCTESESVTAAMTMAVAVAPLIVLKIPLGYYVSATHLVNIVYFYSLYRERVCVSLGRCRWLHSLF